MAKEQNKPVSEVAASGKLLINYLFTVCKLIIARSIVFVVLLVLNNNEHNNSSCWALIIVIIIY